MVAHRYAGGSLGIAFCLVIAAVVHPGEDLRGLFGREVDDKLVFVSFHRLLIGNEYSLYILSVVALRVFSLAGCQRHVEGAGEIFREVFVQFLQRCAHVAFGTIGQVDIKTAFVTR